MRIARTTMPHGVVGIDWNNPITRKLVGAGVTDMNERTGVRNALTRVVGGYETGVYDLEYGPAVGAEVEATRDGEAIYFGGGGYGRRVYFALPVDDANYSTPDLTSLAVFIPWTGATSVSLVRVSDSSFALPIEVNLNSGGVVSGLQGDDTGNTITHQNSVMFDRANVVVYRNKHKASPIFQDLWLNGVKSSTTTSSTAQNGFSADYVQYGQLTDPDWSIGFLLQLVWNRVLSDGEVMSLSRNPWQLFEPERRTVFLPPQVTETTKRWSSTLSIPNIQPETFVRPDYEVLRNFHIRGLWAIFGDGSGILANSFGACEHLKYNKPYLTNSKTGVTFNPIEVGGVSADRISNGTNHLIDYYTLLEDEPNYSFSMIIDGNAPGNTTKNPIRVFSGNNENNDSLSLTIKYYGDPDYSFTLEVRQAVAWAQNLCTYDIPTTFSGIITITYKSSEFKIYTNGIEVSPSYTEYSIDSLNLSDQYLDQHTIWETINSNSWFILPRINLVFLHNRALSSAEAMSLSKVYWKAFKQISRMSYLDKLIAQMRRIFYIT